MTQAAVLDAGARSAIARSLAFHAALMALLGLLSGFTTLFAKAPTAALSAHTIGLLQAALLFGVAGAWHLLDLTPRRARVIQYALLVGCYVNWLGVQLAALWGAKGMFVVSGAAMAGGAAGWMEALVAVLLNLSILVVVACGLILWAARARSAGAAG